MQTSNRFIAVALVAGAALAANAAKAFEGNPVSGPDAAIPLVSPPAALAPAVSAPIGTPALRKVAPATAPTSHSPSTSLSALQYAAEGGHPIAQWKLGQMYAVGDGVAQNDLRAFEYFSRIASAHAEDNPTAPQASIVARAFVALGRYYLDGIPNSRVKADPDRAREMFHYAASYFGNADAQYNLARLYLDGSSREAKSGLRWLSLAVQKNHYQAQALLGQMMFNGDQLPRQAAKGLMYLTLARDSAGPGDAWIRESYASAMKKASENDRAMALQLLERWVRGQRD
ncbi:MAG: tetratricopeptide repeat protein [Pseudomonadota bacterium]|jgi:TPR repeat protein